MKNYIKILLIIIPIGVYFYLSNNKKIIVKEVKVEQPKSKVLSKVNKIPTPKKTVDTPSIFPIKGIKNKKKISSSFAKRLHPITGKLKFHAGLDIASKIGTPVVATAKGIVVSVNRSNDGYGNQILLSHDKDFQTRYAHLNNIVFAKGDKVEKGEVIGFVGTTGLSTGPHLHYEVIKKGKKLNPKKFLK